MKEIGLNVYGKHSCELLSAAVFMISNDLHFSGAASRLLIRMRADGEVYAMHSCYRMGGEDAKKSISERIRAGLAYQLKRLIAYAMGCPDVDSKDKASSSCKLILKNRDKAWELISIKTTVGELRCLYEILLGRDEKRIRREYGDDVFKVVKGEPANCFVSMQKDIYSEEIAKLKREYEAQTAALANAKHREIAEVAEKFNNLAKERFAQYEEAVKALKSRFGEDIITEVDEWADLPS